MMQRNKKNSQISALFRLMHPSLFTMTVSDVIGIRGSAYDSRRHLDGTMEWLCRAQDVTREGVSVGYSVAGGWLPPYPETTGYIIPTFYDYAALTGNDEYRTRALKMAEWEVEVQMANGAVQAGAYYGPDADRAPAAFNTGQVILGFCRAFEETRDAKFLQAGVRAGNWLVEAQGKDGAWRLSGAETETDVHSYDVRNAWSLLELHRLTDDLRYCDSARANCEWTLKQQLDNGWFENNAFFLSSNKWSSHPFTHTIAYVMEGLLECSRLTKDDRYFQPVMKTARKLQQIFDANKFMPGEFDKDWNGNFSYSCLTGNAQIAGVWLRLYNITGDESFFKSAVALNDYVKSTQLLDSTHPGIKGGVKGSQPFHGRYTRFVFINWGAKFLADSLMLELGQSAIMKKLNQGL